MKDNIIYIDNHFSTFAPAWWTPRRKRDYRTDELGRVKLRLNSETATRVRQHLASVTDAAS